MRHIRPAKAALSVGIVMGLYHLVWIALVVSGLAKPFLLFVLRLHFIRFDFEMAPFAPVTAVMLVGLTFSIGALVGLAFALVWNWLTDRATEQAG